MTEAELDKLVHGITRMGQLVHRRTLDHLPSETAYQRINKTLALKITDYVGSMTCAYVFTILALVSLPAVITQAGLAHFFPHWMVAVGLIALVSWVAQTFLQLVLLSVIIVGQNVQSAASDARAAKTFEDAEQARAGIQQALDLLDVHTQGGLKDILDAIDALKARA